MEGRDNSAMENSWRHLRRPRGQKGRTEGVCKGRKGFLLGTSGGRIGPGNCSVRRLFGNPLFLEAILRFLADTGVGKIKRGVIVRGEAVE